MKKTNAARILDRQKVSYSLKEYQVDEDDLSAENVARTLGLPPAQVFKTLVARGDKSGVIIVSIPGGGELDLKALAKASGNKKVEMVHLREIKPLTGYIRGAVSPLGIKGNYPYYLDAAAFKFPQIVVSSGVRGLQITMAPQDLAAVTAAKTGALTR